MGDLRLHISMAKPASITFFENEASRSKSGFVLLKYPSIVLEVTSMNIKSGLWRSGTLSPFQRSSIQLLIIIQVAREIPDLKVIRSNRVGLNISFFANSSFFFFPKASFQEYKRSIYLGRDAIKSSQTFLSAPYLAPR